MHFAKKFRGPPVQERVLLGVVYLWEYMQKVAATLLSASRKGAVGA